MRVTLAVAIASIVLVSGLGIWAWRSDFRGLKSTVTKSKHEGSIEDMLPVRPRMDEAQFLAIIKQQGWECASHIAEELDNHLPDDLYYTCQVNVELAYGKFTRMDLVTRAQKSGRRQITPLLVYYSHTPRPRPDCEAMTIGAVNALKKGGWKPTVKNDEEGSMVLGENDGQEGYETLAVACIPESRSVVSWMLLGNPSQRAVRECEPRPTDSNGWVRSVERKCVDRTWFCNNATLEKWMIDYGRADPLASAKVRSGDIALIGLVTSGYIKLMKDAGCTVGQVLAVNPKQRSLLQPSLDRIFPNEAR